MQRAILETRLSVRRALEAARLHVLPSTQSASALTSTPAMLEKPEPLVLVAVSGGADSLALAAAVAAEAPKHGLRAGAVIIDHGLQAGSADVADWAATVVNEWGLSPVIMRGVVVDEDRTGPEAAARAARYDAFAAVAAENDAVAVLTAHTRDDQAEQVMLALARGSGTRSLAGIPHSRQLGEAP